MTAESRYASRKFILAAFSILAVLVLFCVKWLSEEVFAECLRWILGLYFTGNVAMAAVTKVIQKNA